jgi:hypothetical protein
MSASGILTLHTTIFVLYITATAATTDTSKLDAPSVGAVLFSEGPPQTQPEPVCTVISPKQFTCVQLHSLQCLRTYYSHDLA